MPKINQTLYIFDKMLLRPIKVKLIQVNDDGWYRVKFLESNTWPGYFDLDDGQYTAEPPQEFFENYESCVMSIIERLMATYSEAKRNMRT